MKRDKIKSIVYDAMFLALFAIFTFVPYLGLYQIGPVSFTILHLFVILGASLFGYKKATLYGFFMGLMTLLKAISFPGTFDYFFVNPFISVLPRVLFGLCTGLIFDCLKKFLNQKQFIVALIPASIFSAFLHTFLVVMCWYLFGILDPFYITKALGLGELVKDMTFQTFVFSFLVWGSLVEILIAGVIIPTLYGVVSKVFKIGLIKDKVKNTNLIENKIETQENNNY